MRLMKWNFRWSSWHYTGVQKTTYQAGASPYSRANLPPREIRSETVRWDWPYGDTACERDFGLNSFWAEAATDPVRMAEHVFDRLYRARYRHSDCLPSYFTSWYAKMSAAVAVAVVTMRPFSMSSAPEWVASPPSKFSTR